MAKTLTIIFGVIIVLFGLLGFVSNPLIGTGALFATDAVFNSICIILGVILLAVAFWAGGNSVLWLQIIGAMIFLLGLIGIFTDGALLGIAYTNSAVSWLDLIAGAIIFAAGMYSKDETHSRMPPVSPLPPSNQ